MVNDIYVCPHCKRQMPPFFRGAFRGGYLNKKLNIFRQRYFCSKECYEDYKKNFVMEIYNNQPIYCVEIDGEKRYMPYFEANYYFTNIDDCKKRMDMKGIAVINNSAFKFIWANAFK
jgi:hypothetical protein